MSISVNDSVQHNFSKTKGRVHAIKKSGRYRYFVVWENGDGDWYQHNVLEQTS